MKTLYHLAVAALLATFLAPAQAQSQHFDGFNIGVRFNFDSAALTATDGASSSASNTGVTVSGQYALALGSRLILGLGATADVAKRKAGSYANGVEASTRDRYSVDLMPGFVFNDETMMYLKASAVAAKGMADNGSSSIALQGLGYGFGLRGGVRGNYYWQLGYEAIRFREADTGTGSGVLATFSHSIVTMGIGYRF